MSNFRQKIDERRDDIDLQVHDVSARSFDLTNVIRTGATSTEKVIATEAKANTLDDYVCKYGRTTGQTCGLVTNINFMPLGAYGASNDYVQVTKIAGAIGDMACGGDSGLPVYKYIVGGGVWRNNLGYTRNVPLNNNGTINWGAGAIWSQCCSGTAPRSQDAYIVGNHYYQNVFWTETTCTQYKRALDNNGNPTGATTTQNCRTSLPAGSSGTINSYTAYVVGGRLREGIWRNGIGYTRDVPLNATNTDIAWNSAPAWQQCCVSTPPRAQGGDILSYP